MLQAAPRARTSHWGAVGRDFATDRLPALPVLCEVQDCRLDLGVWSAPFVPRSRETLQIPRSAAVMSGKHLVAPAKLPADFRCLGELYEGMFVDPRLGAHIEKPESAVAVRA